MHFDPLCTVHEQGRRNLQLHRETVQSPATFVASLTTWGYRVSLCSMLHFNLLEQAIYCILADDAAVLTLPTCGLQLVDNFLRLLLFHIQLLQQAPNLSLQRITPCFTRPGARKLLWDHVVAKRAGVATLAAKCRGEEQTPRKIGANQSHIKMRKPSKTIEILMLTFCKPNHDSHLPFRLKI